MDMWNKSKNQPSGVSGYSSPHQSTHDLTSLDYFCPHTSPTVVAVLKMPPWKVAAHPGSDLAIFSFFQRLYFCPQCFCSVARFLHCKGISITALMAFSPSLQSLNLPILWCQDRLLVASLSWLPFYRVRLLLFLDLCSESQRWAAVCSYWTQQRCGSRQKKIRWVLSICCWPGARPWLFY